MFDVHARRPWLPAERSRRPGRRAAPSRTFLWLERIEPRKSLICCSWHAPGSPRLCWAAHAQCSLAPDRRGRSGPARQEIRPAPHSVGTCPGAAGLL